ncbi:MAG: acetyltransferase [Frankiales bacterium]|nr:acetyltransferase [Frankiales bacterium]
MTTAQAVADPRIAGAVLGRAFMTDPVFGWLLHGRTGLQQRLTLVFESFAAGALPKQDAQVLVTEERTAASIWLPPGHWKTSTADLVRQGPKFVRGLGSRTPRALGLLTRIEKHHPAEPHWYLEAIGTVPEARGQGIGPRVLLPVLDRCDAEGVPAYLESSNPRNIAFYERHGFVKRPLFPLPDGCPVITPMWRDPR